MPEPVLITGGAGFIGLHLARALLDRGTPVTLIDNFWRGRQDAELREVCERATLVEHDLTQPLPDDLPGGPFAQVYHLAAIVGVRYTTEVPHQVLRTNLLSTTHVLDWCARHTPRVVCLSSTSEVADGAGRVGLAELPLPEDLPFVVPDPAAPRASYGLSKMASELLLVHYARAYGFAARITRYHNVYGPRMGFEHVIPQFIARVVAGRDPFSIYGAYQSRAFCYVDDAVEATLRLAALEHTEPVVLNIGNDREELQIVELARRLFRIASCSPALDIQPPPPGSPDRRLPNLERLRQLTGFEPRVSLDEGLRRTFAWYRAHLAEREPWAAAA